MTEESCVRYGNNRMCHRLNWLPERVPPSVMCALWKKAESATHPQLCKLAIALDVPMETFMQAQPEENDDFYYEREAKCAFSEQAEIT